MKPCSNIKAPILPEPSRLWGFGKAQVKLRVQFFFGKGVRPKKLESCLVRNTARSSCQLSPYFYGATAQARSSMHLACRESNARQDLFSDPGYANAKAPEPLDPAVLWSWVRRPGRLVHFLLFRLLVRSNCQLQEPETRPNGPLCVRHKILVWGFGLGGRRPDPCLLVPNASWQEAEANWSISTMNLQVSPNETLNPKP